MKLKLNHAIITFFAVMFIFRFSMSPNPFEKGYPFGLDNAAHYRRAYLIYQYGLNFWDPMQGNGVPEIRFYSLFPYYLIALFSYLLPFDFVYKMIDAISFAVVPILQYLWLRDLKIKRSISLISVCFLFVAGPHYYIALYAQQVPLLFAFIPMYLYLICMQRMIRLEKNYILYSTIAFSLLILSYPPAAYISFFFSVFYLIYYISEANRVKKLDLFLHTAKKIGIMFFIAFALTSFWVIPTLIEKSFVNPISNAEQAVGIATNEFVETIKWFNDYLVPHDRSLFDLVKTNTPFSFIDSEAMSTLFRVVSIIASLLFVFFFVIFFKKNLYFSLAIIFLFSLSGFKNILPFYILRDDHGVEYLPLFTSFIFAFGLYWIFNRIFKSSKKAQITVLILAVLCSGFQSYIFLFNFKLPNFDITNEQLSFVNLLKQNNITKVYDCGSWFLPVYMTPYSSWGPTLLIQNGIESEEAGFSGLMDIIDYGSSLIKPEDITTKEEFYNSLKLRGVQAVILSNHCFNSPDSYNGRCKFCIDNLVDNFDAENNTILLNSNYNAVDQNYLPNILLQLKGDVSKVNCDKEVTTFYRRISDVDIDVKFSSDSEDLTCTVAESNYPLWNAYLNGEKVEIGTYTGLMQFHFDNITSGDILTIKHEFSIHYYYSAVISVMSAILIAFILIKRKINKPKSA